MKNKLLLVIGMVLAFLLLIGGTAAAAPVLFAGGDGSLGNPYQIENLEQLNAVREDLTANYILNNDIDMSAYTAWEPIGRTEWNQGANTWNKEFPFTGTFDGAGHTIYNFTHLPETTDPLNRQPDGNGSGLFGYINNSEIKNVRMENIRIESVIMDHNNVGVLVSHANNSSIINCSSVNGSIELTGLLWLSNAGYTGGIVGKADNSTIKDCYSDVNIKTHFHLAGGLAGGVINTNVTNCSATGNVSARSTVGGLIGGASVTKSDDIYIKDCFSTGNTFGMTVPCKNSLDLGGGTAAGFIGTVSQTGTTALIHISNCNSTGNASVENGTTAGGFIGELRNGTVSDCYATGSVYASGYTYDNGTLALGYAGGFIGKMNNGTIQDSFVSNTVSTFDEAGGFIGQMTNGSIQRCRAVTNTTAENSSAGGFIGIMKCGTIEESYALGDVYAKSDAGGFVGTVNDTTAKNEIKINNTYSVCDVKAGENNAGGFIGQVIAHGKNILIANSYTAGSVESIGTAGGLIAKSGENVLSNAFYDKTAANTEITAGGSGGKGKNTDEMKNITVFKNAGWDITKDEPSGSSVWYILEDYGYPVLTSFYPETVYIETEEEFKMIGTRVYEYDADDSGQKKFWHTNANYILTGDIFLPEKLNFEPVGNESLPFKGSLTNQANYVIHNLKIEKPAEENVGFIGFAKNAVLTGIQFENTSVAGDYTAGTIIGNGTNITLINCAVESGNVSAFEEVGGLIGKADGAVLTNCSFEGDFVKATGTYFAGGLIGNASNITVSNSFAEVKEVYSENEYAGGLVGFVSKSASVSQSGFSGNVTAGYAYAGGLIGEAEKTIVSQSFAKGNVTANTHSAGGLIGALSAGKITESFATTGTVTADEAAGGLIGFADGDNAEIIDVIATNSIHTTNGKAGGLIGTVAAASQIQIENGFALNRYVNGTADTGSLIGSADSGNVQIQNSFNWDGIKNGNVLMDTETGIHGTEISAEDVWDNFDENSAWDLLSAKTNWQKDEYSRYLLPILAWQNQPFVADALYLVFEEETENKNTGSTTDSKAIIKETVAAPVTPENEIPEKGFETEILTPPVETAVNMMPILLIFLAAIGIYICRRKMENDDEN
ncbi:hypothetical protein MmiEs2_00320 [Methanimicrococcus stummii]|uniref:GLUG domain-containing protein n=1 Tax=Methanimicrococcus stummii TaxID=3028294 RepID=A0AA96ZWJ9_9EURY|nr:GLUG motif-containing protein [Methanimicrococcus sp. Es2]WNY27859.1 hypothetical protein MmiEs2_00320 [Methanimicrococcus sp. Es2]